MQVKLHKIVSLPTDSAHSLFWLAVIFVMSGVTGILSHRAWLGQGGMVLYSVHNMPFFHTKDLNICGGVIWLKTFVNRWTGQLEISWVLVWGLVFTCGVPVPARYETDFKDTQSHTWSGVTTSNERFIFTFYKLTQVTRLCDLSVDGDSVTSVCWNERVSTNLLYVI